MNTQEIQNLLKQVSEPYLPVCVQIIESGGWITLHFQLIHDGICSAPINLRFAGVGLSPTPAFYLQPTYKE